jgi:hypothetical protein
MAFAVIAMIGILAAIVGSARMRCVASTPFIIGMRMSISTKSKDWRSTARTASVPSSTTSTEKPACFSAVTISRWFTGLSSATSRRSGPPAALGTTGPAGLGESNANGGAAGAATLSGVINSWIFAISFSWMIGLGQAASKPSARACWS